MFPTILYWSVVIAICCLFVIGILSYSYYIYIKNEANRLFEITKGSNCSSKEKMNNNIKLTHFSINKEKKV